MRMTRLALPCKQLKLAAADSPQARQDTNMTYQSNAQILTVNGSRYLQQLCKHWSHKLSVEFTPTSGKVTFPRNARGADWPADAVLSLEAVDGILDCRLEASAVEQLDALKGVVENHLGRFAFRETPLRFDWLDRRTP